MFNNKRFNPALAYLNQSQDTNSNETKNEPNVGNRTTAGSENAPVKKTNTGGKRKMAKRAKGNEERKSERIQVQLKPTVLSALDKYAEEHEVSRQTAIEHFINVMTHNLD